MGAVFVAASATLMVGGGVAMAAPTPNDNNCAGVFVTGLVPEFTSTDAPAFGQARADAARQGLIGEAEKAATEQYASCGNP